MVLLPTLPFMYVYHIAQVVGIVTHEVNRF